jgi:hypothetical protein
MNGIRVVDEELRPEISDGVSLGGEWTYNIFLANAGDDAIAGINFDWDGQGLIIEVSLDGSTWEEVEQGVNVGLIPFGFDPTDTNLYLRVTFEDGSTEDDQYLDYIHVIGVRTQSQNIYGHVVTIDGHRLRAHEPMEQHALWGVRLDTGDEITIASSTADDAEVHAVEIWMKDVDGDFPTTNLYTPADDITVQNAVVTPKTDVYGKMEPGAWYRVVFLMDDSFDSDIVITGPGQVGYVALYASPYTDGNKYNNQYFEYTGDVGLRQQDTDFIAVSENVSRTRFYAEDWTIQAS